jgi:hypothetical protein
MARSVASKSSIWAMHRQQSDICADGFARPPRQRTTTFETPIEKDT